MRAPGAVRRERFGFRHIEGNASSKERRAKEDPITMATSMNQAQQSGTGTANHVYDLVSVLYHALESGATNQQYIQDAKQAGDNDLVQFFQEIQRGDQQRAEKAKQLLKRQMQ